MTRFNVTKSNKEKEAQQILTTNLVTFINQIKTENNVLVLEKSTFSATMASALKEQKDKCNEKHKTILLQHSEKLKEKYKANFDEAISFYRKEIGDLNKKLQIANKLLQDSLSKSHTSEILSLQFKLTALSKELSVTKKLLLSSNERKPVFSPGRYNCMPP